MTVSPVLADTSARLHEVVKCQLPLETNRKMIADVIFKEAQPIEVARNHNYKAEK